MIVLTARGEIEDRVGGLDAGAVDYLVKPFSLAELAARVRVQLRLAAQTTAGTLRFGDIEVDLLTRQVRRGEEQVRLSTTEFELLVYLLRHRGRVLSREQILSAVWGYEHDPNTNIVDVYIGYLRRKLNRPERPGPDLHGAHRRLPLWRCSLAARRSRRHPRGLLRASLRRRLAAIGLRWRLAAWVAVVMLVCTGITFVAVYRGTGTQLRHQIDQEIAGDASELSRTLASSGARSPRQVAQAATRYVRAQPFSASSTLLFVTVPGVGTSTNNPELFARATPDNDETPAVQDRRTACRRSGERARGIFDAALPRRRRSASAQAHA